MGSLLLVLIYVSFVSLGLPDSLLGAAWPVIHTQISVPVSFAGIISTTISLGSITSSFFSGKLLARFSAGKITAVSTLMTAAGLVGFSVSRSFPMFILFAIPFGLGAGGVDAVLNNYVALHYKAQHMSWLHCMWGVGAAVSPYIMTFSLLKLDSWSWGYGIVAVIQASLAAVLFISLPVWRKGADETETESAAAPKSLSLREIFQIKGAAACFLTFFCYCALEVTASLWASTYLVERWSVGPEAAASFASMFYIGLTGGRFINGFFAMKFSDKTLIRAGAAVIAVGIALLFVPVSAAYSIVGFVIIGLGCAPIYPCIIHMTPDVFGKERSQAMIGVQMAFAYTGFLIMPTLTGVILEYVSIYLLPVFLIIFGVIMAVLHEKVVRSGKNNYSDR